MMRRVFLATIVALTVSSTTTWAAPATKTPLPSDETQSALELAYRRLRLHETTAKPGQATSAHESSAYRLLERAAARFDDLDDDRDALAAAVGGDASAAWRGRPYERVMALLTLATLDVRKRRCDLALPTIKNAMHMRTQGRLQAGASAGAADHDVVLANVLRLRCAAITRDEALAHDVTAELRAAVGDGAAADAFIAMATAPVVVVRFVGRAPAIEARGAHGEVAAVVHHTDTATAFSVTLGSRRRAVAAADATTVYDLKQEATTGTAAAARRAEGAAKKSTLLRQADGYAGRGRNQLTSSRSASGVLGGALLLGAATGLSQTSAIISAEVDTRTVPSMPAAVTLSLPSR